MALKPTMRKSGAKHVTIRIEFYPSRQETVYCLAFQADQDEVPLDERTTKAYVEHALRQCHRVYGVDVGMSTADRLDASELGEEYLSWAEAQIARLYPEWS